MTENEVNSKHSAKFSVNNLDSYLVPITLSSSTTWIDTFVTSVRSCPSVTTASKSYKGCSNLEMLSTTVMVPDRSSTAKGTATYHMQMIYKAYSCLG